MMEFGLILDKLQDFEICYALDLKEPLKNKHLPAEEALEDKIGKNQDLDLLMSNQMV
jgi:hypothetical protein